MPEYRDDIDPRDTRRPKPVALTDTGRTTLYTPETCGTILARLACGESLRSITEEPEMPSKVTVLTWLQKYPDFREAYSLAKAEAHEAIAEELFDIADNGQNDWSQRLAFNGALPSWEPNGEHINRSRLRIDTRKWYLGKIMPKKYGDKVLQEVTGANGGAFVIKLSADDEAI
ncbi:MAG: hypothetical protein NVS1B11_36620 [Terriglobales bacterium]